MMKLALILASGSPRRKELLHFITDDFTVKAPNADETADKNLTPKERVVYLAETKGGNIARRRPDDTVISADTIVVSEGIILGKPSSKRQAFEMLSLLSGKTHAVYTGVCIKKQGKTLSFAEKTDVTFYDLTEAEIMSYIKTGEPFDKAGAYGIQGKGALFIKSINGDFFNVMGLPIARLARELKEIGRNGK